MEFLKLPKPENISEAWWNEVCKKIKNSVVFIDDFVAESLHWSGGLPRLFNYGCKDVKEFSSFETCKVDDEKAVFLLGGLLSGVTLDTLEDIVKNSNLKYVIIVTGAHASVHAYASFGGREVDDKSVMNQLEEKILEWLGNLNYTVEIFYFPLILVAPSEDLFFLPQFHMLVPLFDDEVAGIIKSYLDFNRGDRKPVDSLEELEFHHLPFSLRICIQHFIVCLHSYFQGMNAREEIYSIGHLARLVAGELETYNPARQRRKVASNKVSLVFVDRSLDTASPTDLDGSVLMSRILSLLPRLPGHKVDSAINLSPITKVHSFCEWTIVPGCFGHPLHPKGREIFDMAINAPKRKTINTIKEEMKRLILDNDAPEPEESAASVCNQLMENIKKLLLKDDTLQNHFYLIQQALAVAEVLSHSRGELLDQLHGMEKMLLQLMSDPHAQQSPVTEVLQLLKNRERKGVKIHEILALFIYLCSLGGPHVLLDTSEYAFTNALSQAFIEDREKNCPIVSKIFGDDIDEVSALKTANRIWHRLLAISKARSNLKDYRDLYGRESELEPCRYRSILSQVVEDCLASPAHPVNDLEYKSAGFKDIIKTGFSLFVNVSKPRPKDAALMIIYVLGGVSASEVREVRDLVARHQPRCQVLIGSSHFSYPSDIVEQCLKNKF